MCVLNLFATNHDAFKWYVHLDKSISHLIEFDFGRLLTQLLCIESLFGVLMIGGALRNSISEYAHYQHQFIHKNIYVLLVCELLIAGMQYVKPNTIDCRLNKSHCTRLPQTCTGHCTDHHHGNTDVS